MVIFFSLHRIYAADISTLAIGSKAPDFKLKGVDGKKYSLSKFKKAEILMIVFTCNHCPTAQAYEDRLIKMSTEYKKKVQIVAISPNDPRSLRFDELGYSDLNDSYEDMKLRDEKKQFPFPYLYDGDSQQTSMKYGPIATPHVFIFDKNRILKYQGRIDDVENPNKKPNHTDVRNALDQLLSGKEILVQTTKVFGCSIKWASKSNWLNEYKNKWAEEEVTINTISENDLKHLMHNHGDKLRVVNVWATWCGPCVAEFPDLVTINRMYRGRDFEMITISADHIDDKKKAYNFLKKQQSSTTNYIFDGNDKYKLIEAVDPKWQGGLPYTIIIEPGGKIIYSHQGMVDPYQLKSTIVDSPLIGRFYK
jgi:peroxiredoxin